MFLDHAKELITQAPCYWWDAKRVAGILIASSVGNYEKPDYNPDNNKYLYSFREDSLKNGTGWGMPRFQPATGLQEDIEYLYEVELKKDAIYTIKIFEIDDIDKYTKPQDIILECRGIFVVKETKNDFR